MFKYFDTSQVFFIVLECVDNFRISLLSLIDAEIEQIIQNNEMLSHCNVVVYLISKTAVVLILHSLCQTFW